jgi:periplasmic protein CpxP/Spy
MSIQKAAISLGSINNSTLISLTNIKMKNFSLRQFSLAALMVTGIAFYLPTTIAPVIAQEQKSERRQAFLQQLSLTPEQTQQIKALQDQNQPARQSNMQRLKQLNQEMQALLAGNAANFQITAKFDEIQGLRQQAARAHFEQTLKVREILNPEQRQKFSQLIQSKRDKFRDRMNFRQPNSTSPNQVPN